MKTILTFFAILLTSVNYSQTYIYAEKEDGTKDITNYYYFIADQVFKCENCKEALKDSKSFEKDIKVNINNNEITIEEKDLDLDDPKTKMAFLTDSKKIIYTKKDVLEDGRIIYSNEVTPEMEKNAPYIKENTIFNSENKIIGIINGKEIYAVAWYLLSKK